MIWKSIQETNKKLNEKVMEKWSEKRSQLGAGGGKPEGPFRNFFVPGAPLGANMVPRPVPRASGNGQTCLFDGLVYIFHTFLYVIIFVFIDSNISLSHIDFRWYFLTGSSELPWSLWSGPWTSAKVGGGDVISFAFMHRVTHPRCSPCSMIIDMLSKRWSKTHWKPAHTQMHAHIHTQRQSAPQ